MPGARPVLVDAGPLVALFDRDDAHHTQCVDALKEIRAPLLTVWPVLTEAFYLLSFSLEVQDDFWELVERGGLQIVELNRDAVPRIRALMRRYRDRPMDLADAALVHLGERAGVSTVFTLDHADFRTYRLGGRKPFTLIPDRLA